jgi:hypothetical protein
LSLLTRSGAGKLVVSHREIFRDFGPSGGLHEEGKSPESGLSYCPVTSLRRESERVSTSSDPGPQTEAEREAWIDAQKRLGLAVEPDSTMASRLERYMWRPADEPPPRAEDGDYLKGREWREWVRAQSPVVMVGLSFGKDSLATFHSLLDTWSRDEIVGYWLYSHPNLDWQRRQLAYYRRELGIDIVAVPHRSLRLQLEECLYQPPQNRAVIWQHDIIGVDYEEVYASIAVAAGIAEHKPWVAHGVRAADSPVRRIVITQRGPYNLKTRTFYPIWDERKREVVERIRDLGVKLPVDYRIWGRTFDGLDHRFIAPLAEQLPEDYARLRELFPLMELEFLRRNEPIPEVPEP